MAVHSDSHSDFLNKMVFLAENPLSKATMRITQGFNIFEKQAVRENGAIYS